MASITKLPPTRASRGGAPDPSNTAEVVRPERFAQKKAPPPLEPEPSKNSLVLRGAPLPVMTYQQLPKAAPPLMQLSAQITVPLHALDSAHLTRTCIANMQSAVFDLEKAIAQLIRESEGGSRCIGKLRAVHATLERCLIPFK